jgi:hypothetical protein
MKQILQSTFFWHNIYNTASISVLNFFLSKLQGTKALAYFVAGISDKEKSL